MQKSTHDKLVQYREELKQEVPETKKILSYFEKADFVVTRVESTFKGDNSEGQRAWLVFLAPEDHVREKFALNTEVLLLLLPADTAQARDIAAGEEAILRGHRLDRGLVFIVARDDEIRQRLEGPLLETRWQHVVLNFRSFEENRDWRAWIEQQMLEALGSARSFDPGGPVSGWDFVGRESELNHLRKVLLSGRSVILYGLRKVGKTSLLMRLQRDLYEEAAEKTINAIPIHVDMQAISPAEREEAGFWRRFLIATSTVIEEMEEIGVPLHLSSRLLQQSQIEELSQSRLKEEVNNLFEHLVGWAGENSARVLLLLDEYERLYTDDYFPRSDGLELLDYLRGQVQQTAGVFSLCLTGVDRIWLDTPRFGTCVNPMSNFLQNFPLKGMDHEDLGKLTRKIGRRALLNFDYTAIDAMQRETGGHPWLVRKLGDIIDRNIPIDHREPSADVTQHRVSSNIGEFRADVAQFMEEIAHVICTINEELPELLAYLHLHPDEAGDVAGAWHETDARRLQQLGILENDTDYEWRLSMKCFGQWLVDNYRSLSSKRAAG